MSYINKEAAIDLMASMIAERGHVFNPYKLVMVINDFEGVEIVRCKECKYWQEDEKFCDNEFGMYVHTRADDFCFQGKRKLNNPDDSLVTEDSEDCKEQKSKLESDLISRQAVIDLLLDAQDGSGQTYEVVRELLHEVAYMPPVEPKQSELHIDEPRGYTLKTDKAKAYSERPKGEWISCSEPPEDRRNVFLAHGTNDFKSCCIGHYEQGMGWYEDRNFFAKPIYDCKYWCDIPELPNLGDNQFGTGVSADMRGDKE